jgi:hypothetical protein
MAEFDEAAGWNHGSPRIRRTGLKTRHYVTASFGPPFGFAEGGQDGSREAPA